jgi:hypothetical protein
MLQLGGLSDVDGENGLGLCGGSGRRCGSRIEGNREGEVVGSRSSSGEERRRFMATVQAKTSAKHSTRYRRLSGRHHAFRTTIIKRKSYLKRKSGHWWKSQSLLRDVAIARLGSRWRCSPPLWWVVARCSAEFTAWFYQSLAGWPQALLTK